MLHRVAWDCSGETAFGADAFLKRVVEIDGHIWALCDQTPALDDANVGQRVEVKRLRSAPDAKAPHLHGDPAAAAQGTRRKVQASERKKNAFRGYELAMVVVGSGTF